jgi:hypothetical protein
MMFMTNISFDITNEYKYVNCTLIIILICAIVAPSFIYVPELSSYNRGFHWNVPTCLIREKTGRPCPTCGLTHSIVALYNGNFELSQRYNPLGIIFILIVAVELLLRIVPIINTNKIIPWIDIVHLLLLGPIITILIYR